MANASIALDRWSRSGGDDFFVSAWPVSKIGRDAGVRPLFPPEIAVEVKALACQLPGQLGLAFSRLSSREIAREVVQRGIVASISGTTVWRWLREDALRPWSYRSWIWPRDPRFAEKAGCVLDLYHRVWNGHPLGPKEYVICTDEKTSIQARRRLVPTTPPAPGRPGRVEHEYERRGALAYLAAWDVTRAKVVGLCDTKTGIEPFHRLVELVMESEPYRSARRVFWITDNGSSHRGKSAVDRLSKWYENAILVHTPIHASWMNQVEIFFSVVQRKVLNPNDFDDLAELEAALLAFQSRYEQMAQPFKWKFTREDLRDLPAALSREERRDKQAA